MQPTDFHIQRGKLRVYSDEIRAGGCWNGRTIKIIQVHQMAVDDVFYDVKMTVPANGV